MVSIARGELAPAIGMGMGMDESTAVTQALVRLFPHCTSLQSRSLKRLLHLLRGRPLSHPVEIPE